MVMSYEKLRELYRENFSLKYLGKDINNKLALLGLICYLTQKLKEKKPDVTHQAVIYKIGKDIVPENFLKSLAIICEDLAYGCTEFPTFGVEDKKIISQIKEILYEYNPF